MPEFDISASADEVVALLQHGHAREAATRLETLRRDQPRVMQESLDRLVAAGAGAQLTALRQPDGFLASDAATVRPMLQRLAGAAHPPRFPEPEETSALSSTQLHDIYAGIVATRGNDAARIALTGRDRVILGLRRENRTTQGTSRDNTPQCSWQWSL